MAAAKPIWISSGKLGIFNARTFLDLKRYNYVFSVKKKQHYEILPDFNKSGTS